MPKNMPQNIPRLSSLFKTESFMPLLLTVVVQYGGNWIFIAFSEHFY